MEHVAVASPPDGAGRAPAATDEKDGDAEPSAPIRRACSARERREPGQHVGSERAVLGAVADVDRDLSEAVIARDRDRLVGLRRQVPASLGRESTPRTISTSETARPGSSETSSGRDTSDCGPRETARITETKARVTSGDRNRLSS